MARPPYMPETDINQYKWFMESHRIDTVYIDGYRFRINPTSFRIHRQRTQSVQPTHDGNVRLSYMNAQPVMTFQGHTGLSGLDGINQMEKRFRLLEQNHEQLIKFMFPNRFGDRILTVYVNTFDDTMTDNMHLYYQYEFELVIWPKNRPASYSKVVTPGIDIGLPVGG